MIVSLDGDLQNDPADIPMLLPSCGRSMTWWWLASSAADAALQRKLPSKIANRLIGRVTESGFMTTAARSRRTAATCSQTCASTGSFIAFAGPCLHRRARITEVKVNHRARQFGSSKYGIDRTFRVLMDLLTVWFMKRFLTRPM